MLDPAAHLKVAVLVDPGPRIPRAKVEIQPLWFRPGVQRIRDPRGCGNANLMRAEYLLDRHGVPGRKSTESHKCCEASHERFPWLLSRHHSPIWATKRRTGVRLDSYLAAETQVDDAAILRLE